VLGWRLRLLEFAFDLQLLADDVAMDDFDANDFDADTFSTVAFGADAFNTFDAVAFDADDFGVDAFDAFDATVAFDVDAFDAFDAVDAPLRTRVILTRLVIGSLRWRLKVGVERNHRCVDGRITDDLLRECSRFLGGWRNKKRLWTPAVAGVAVGAPA